MVQRIAYATAIHVRDDQPHPRLGNQVGDIMAYPQSFPGNHYAELVIEEGGEEEMPSLGLTQAHVTQLEKWVRRVRTPKEPTIAVFDWDRTLTVVEGVMLPSDQDWKRTGWPFPAEDILLYLFGDAARLTMIQNMFTMLRMNGVHVFIDTRNSSCTVTPLAYQALVHLVDPRFLVDHIVCAGRQRSKGDALQANPAYQALMKQANVEVAQYLRGGRRARGTRRVARKLRTRRCPRKQHLKRRRDM